jgi:O-antigen ligase
MILLSLAAGVVFSFGVAIFQIVTDTGPTTFNQRGMLRAYGLFGEPNPFAAYLAMATLALLAYTFWAMRLDRLDDLMPLVAAGTSGVGFVALSLTQSRGGAIGFAAGLAVLIWFSFPRVGRLLMAAGCAMMVLGLLTPMASPVRSTFGIDTLLTSGPVQVTPDNFAAQERLAHWGAALRMWLDNPVVGIGAGNLMAHFREYTPEWRFRIPRGHAHNGYLQAAAQAGTIGLICYLAVLTMAWRRARRHLAVALTLDQRAACVGALGVTAAIAVHGVFEYVHVLSLGIVVSAIWASIEFDVDPSSTAVVIHDGD